jgi:hypothetical protein
MSESAEADSAGMVETVADTTMGAMQCKRKENVQLTQQWHGHIQGNETPGNGPTMSAKCPGNAKMASETENGEQN